MPLLLSTVACQNSLPVVPRERPPRLPTTDTGLLSLAQFMIPTVCSEPVERTLSAVVK